MKENHWQQKEIAIASIGHLQQQQEQVNSRDKRAIKREHDKHRQWLKRIRVKSTRKSSYGNQTSSSQGNNEINNHRDHERAAGHRDGEPKIFEKCTESKEDSSAEARTSRNFLDVDKIQDEFRSSALTSILSDDDSDVNLSFCGCGFLGIYHVGVASSFHHYAPQLSMHKIAGSSAGALVACAHLCGNLQLAYATTDIIRVAIDARAHFLGPFHPSFDINETVKETLERRLPEDVHLRTSGRLHISLTRVEDNANVIVSQFDSKDEVIQALICSCFIPFYSGFTEWPKFKGVFYMDGGFSNNQLILDDKSVTVSPFSGKSDICPKDDSLNLLQISLANTSFSLSPKNLYRLSHALAPPSPEVLSDLYAQGFADGIRFLQRMKLISCTKCLEFRSSLLVTTNREELEEAYSHQLRRSESIKSTTSSFSVASSRIKLEKTVIEINREQRRNSVTSMSGQVYQHQIQSGSSSPSVTSLAVYDDEFGECEDCNECDLMRQKALCDPLPAQFNERIRDACDAVDKSLPNWIYSYRPVKYLSCLAFPAQISSALLLRCWQELPSSCSELVHVLQTLVKFLFGMLKRIHSRSTSAMLMDSDLSMERDNYEFKKQIVRFVGAEAGATLMTETTTTTIIHTIVQSILNV